ncbi:MAG: (4Fe-4S)-binding protein [Cyclobacteriaceae bacterium]
MKKEYKNEEITITWRPDVCIHSEKCFHGLSSVFNPNNRPWVNLDAAENKTIIDQVKQCPSGALSGKYNLEEASNETNGKTISIDISPDGPIMIKGSAEINYKGNVQKRPGKITALCRCGASSNKPYCDGSHKTSGFTD